MWDESRYFLKSNIFVVVYTQQLVPVTARCKAHVYGHSSAEIVGWNPAQGVTLVSNVVCCRVQVSATSYHSSRGVLPAAVHRCVSSSKLKNGPRWAAVPYDKKRYTYCKTGTMNVLVLTAPEPRLKQSEAYLGFWRERANPNRNYELKKKSHLLNLC
jgi:hypothetical protein